MSTATSAHLTVADTYLRTGNDEFRSTTAVQLVADGGGWSGTITFEVSNDGGVTFVPLNGLPTNSATPASTATAAGGWTFDTSGWRLFQARLSTATSGGVTVYIQPVRS